MNNKGFSLVELAIALGLVAVLVSVVTSGGGMMIKSRVHRETVAVDSIRVAAQNYLTSKNLTYTGISIAALKTDGLLPASFEPVKANSFGGDYVVTENPADSTRVDISVLNVPETAGTELSNNFRNKAELLAYDKSSKVWKATF